MENTFGDFLKERRKNKSLTQKQLAGILYVSESAVSKWEKNIAHPDIDLIPKLSSILGVTEHELITASIDKDLRQQKVQAKKYRAITMSWNLFFYISYSIAILTCFICNLATSGTLSWFWVVLSALVLAFTLTNLPALIKSYRLVLIPASMYLALVLLLGVCAIYTKGTWFWVATLSVLLGLIIIFMPIFIVKYSVFNKLKKFNDFVSVGIDFILLNILLVVINIYTATNGFSNTIWCLNLALPIVAIVYITLNILLCVRFLKVNKFLKTSLILLLVNIFLYLPPIFIKFKNTLVQKEIDGFDIFKADFSCWVPDVNLENNVNLIIFLTISLLIVVFFVIGLIKHLKSKNKK